MSYGFTGGANDGVLHYPIEELWLGVGKGHTTANTPGDVSFSNGWLLK